MGASGCAYYNGLYNANQLARQAQVAEREGRRAEARSLWIQVAVKAESVVVKYPDSRYHDDALLMQGLALHQVGEYERAVVPLGLAMSISEDDALVVESRFLLAESWIELREPESAREALDPLAHLVDPTVASRRRFLLGRAALVAGDPAGALSELSVSGEGDAQYQRVVALLALGRVREAANVIDSTRREAYFEDRWNVALRSIAAVDHRVASALVDRLRDDADVTGGQEARLLIADGERWVPVDAARARTRFLEAVDVAGDSLEAALALAHLSVLEFRRTDDLSELAHYQQTFRAILAEGGGAVSFLEPFALVINDVLIELTDGTRPLRLFRRAEEVRDSLGALPMAARLFRAVAVRHDRSVISPKALLAMAALKPATADSVGRVLRRRYPRSPYTLIVSGLPAPEYAVVEDSLRRLLDSFAFPSLRGSAALPLRSAGPFPPDSGPGEIRR